MGKASERKWANRFQRRVLSRLQDQFPGKTPAEIEVAVTLPENHAVFGQALRETLREVQARKAALAAWRAIGGGLRDVLRVGGAP